MNTVLSPGALLPLAHAGHYALWVLYAVPLLIVVAAIVKSTITQRRRPAATEAHEPGDGDGDPGPGTTAPR